MLVMYPGLAEQQDFPLTPGARLTIGRTKDNAVLCLHKSLSRTHAEVVYDGSVVQLTDLQSKNGVFVNGRRIARAELGEGDAFRCGDVPFLLEGTSKSDPAAKKAPRTPAKEERRVEHTLPSPFAVDTIKSRPPPPTTEPVVTDDRTKEKLFLLMRASELCVSDLPTDKLLQELVGLTAQVLETDRLSVLLLDEKTFELRLRVGKSFAKASDRPYSLRVVDWVLDHASPASYDDLSRDRSLPGDLSRDAEVRAAMCVPLNPGSGLIGVMYADSLTRPACFKADDLALLRAIANLAAVAIESAQLRSSKRSSNAR